MFLLLYLQFCFCVGFCFGLVFYAHLSHAFGLHFRPCFSDLYVLVSLHTLYLFVNAIIFIINIHKNYIFGKFLKAHFPSPIVVHKPYTLLQKIVVPALWAERQKLKDENAIYPRIHSRQMSLELTVQCWKARGQLQLTEIYSRFFILEIVKVLYHCTEVSVTVQDLLGSFLSLYCWVLQYYSASQMFKALRIRNL